MRQIENHEVLMTQQRLITEARELHASPRWSNPNAPASADIEELHSRLAAPATYAQFRAIPEGAFLLPLIEAYENALNDDWMPHEICGLSLQVAQNFIGQVAAELEANDLPNAVSRLKKRYDYLTKP